MKLRSLGADAGAFAHLFGRKKAEEEKKPADATPEDEKDAAEDPEEGEKPEDEEKTPEGEDPEDDKDASEEDPEKEEKAEARGARAERARCRAILAAPEAALNPQLAMHFALETDLPVRQAVQALKAGGRSGAHGLGARMATLPPLALGAGDAPQTSKKGAVMAGWDAAFKRAGIATTDKTA